jgi:hypothetical protein
VGEKSGRVAVVCDIFARIFFYMFSALILHRLKLFLAKIVAAAMCSLFIFSLRLRSGNLVSYAVLRKHLVEKDLIEQAIKSLAPSSILMITATNIVDGNLPPFYTETKQNSLVGRLIASWKFQGYILRSTAFPQPGESEWGMSDRSWCYEFPETIVEVGLPDGLELERLTEDNILFSILGPNSHFNSTFSDIP